MDFLNLFLLNLVFCFISAFSEIAPVGVPASKVILYQAGKDFTCLDGSTVVPFDFVNDDFCDCLDGSDEPGTSACNNSEFYCPNIGFKPSFIPSSQVNDGICDCCDGSDEYLTKHCNDTCSVLGSEALAEAKRQRELINQGNYLRVQMSTTGKQLREQKKGKYVELLKEKTIAEVLKKEAEELKTNAETAEQTALDVYRQLEENERLVEAEREKETFRQEALEIFTHLDTNQDSKIQSEELLSYLQESKGSVSGKDSTYEEEVKFIMYEKPGLTWEEFYEKSWSDLKPIFAREKGRTDEEVGENINKEPTDILEDQSLKHDKLPEGEEDEEEEEEDEEEVDRSHSEFPSIPSDGQENEGTTEQPQLLQDDAKYDDQTKKLIEDATKARQNFEEKERSLRDIEREMSNLMEYLEKDYGPEDEFAPLDGQCFSYSDREYNYKLCPFDQVTQGGKQGGSETRLGLWNRWGSEYSEMFYDKGQSCWNGPQRSVKVLVSCGLENEVVSASEPSKCEYLLGFKTPAACRVLPAKSNDDTHDEL